MICNGLCKLTTVKVVLVALFVIVNVLLYAQSKYVIIVFHQFETNWTSSSTSNGINQQISESSSNNSIRSAIFSAMKYPFLKERVLNPHDYTFIVQPNVSCSNRYVELFIGVSISRANFKGRTTVRETWGNYSKDAKNNAVLVFFIGSNGDFTNQNVSKEIQTQIEQEAILYGDILQSSFVDSYVNLSLKSVSILKWVQAFCSEAKFLLKVDDDMYVNIPFLVNILRNLDTKTPSAFVMGSMQVGAGPIRNKNSKWYTPYNLYSEARYPNYVSGTSYVVSRDAVFLLFEASLRVPLFWLEDVYITGLCSRKAGVHVVHSDRFTYEKPAVSGCSFRAHFSGHRYTQEEIRRIHKELYDPKLKCG